MPSTQNIERTDQKQRWLEEGRAGLGQHIFGVSRAVLRILICNADIWIISLAYKILLPLKGFEL